MIDRIKELKELYRKAKTDEDFARIDGEMDALFAEDSEAASRAMLDDLKDTVQEAEEESLRSKISGILPAISVSYIAKTYFHRSPAWFNQRLNGNIVNGKKARFSEDELRTLSNALQEISEQLKAASFVF